MMKELLRIAHLRIVLFWEFRNFTSPILATNSFTMHECHCPGNLWGEPYKPQPAVLVPRERRALWGFHRLSRSPAIAGQEILYNCHSGCVVDFFLWGTNIFFLYWLVKGVVVKNDKKLFFFCFAISSRRNIAFHDCNCFCEADADHNGSQWSMIIDIMSGDR